MKAIVIRRTGGPEVLELSTMPMPEPGPHQLLVANRASGVNPVDTYLRDGVIYKPTLPYIPGWDGAGVVEAVGAEVKGFQPGQRVWYHQGNCGSLAEFSAIDQDNAFPLPDHLSFEQGSALGVPYGTAYRALVVRGGLRDGESVLIHGASGAVGVAAVQFAVSRGCHVTASAGTAEGEALLREQGAQVVFNHHAENGLETAREQSPEGRGFDLILENLANVNLGRDLAQLAFGGRVVVVGSRGPVQIDARNLMARDADIRGMSLMHAKGREKREIYGAVQSGILTRSLIPVVGKVFPLAEAGAAHAAVMASGARGKIAVAILQ